MGLNAMKTGEYLKLLRELYLAHFDMEKNKEILGHQFDLYAFCEVKNEKYIAHQSLKIYSYKDYEHCLVELQTVFDGSNLTREFFKNCVEELIEIDNQHHQTYLTYVIAVEQGVSGEQAALVRNFKFSKSYLLGLKGWCDLRLILIDLQSHEVYSNKKGREVVDKYNPDWLKARVDEIYR